MNYYTHFNTGEVQDPDLLKWISNIRYSCTLWCAKARKAACKCISIVSQWELFLIKGGLIISHCDNDTYVVHSNVKMTIFHDTTKVLRCRCSNARYDRTAAISWFICVSKMRKFEHFGKSKAHDVFFFGDIFTRSGSVIFLWCKTGIIHRTEGTDDPCIRWIATHISTPERYKIRICWNEFPKILDILALFDVRRHEK